MSYHEPEEYIDEISIKAEIARLGQRITADFKDKKLSVICIANGGVLFAADLIRAIKLPLRLDTLAAESYVGQQSGGKLHVRSEQKFDVRGDSVLLVDDILDTGCTLSRIVDMLMDAGAAEVRTCVLLDKKAHRQCELKADYAGFEIDDEFVVGYGLDYNELFRNLPYIGIMRRD